MTFKIAPNALACGNIASASGSLTNTALNTAYVHNTSGVAVAFRMNARDTNPITEAYVYIGLFTGTKANVTMACQIFGELAGNAVRPSATPVLATSSTYTNPSGATGWARFTFASPYSPANVGEVVWLVFYNTSAAPTVDFPSVRTLVNVSYPSQNVFTCYSTTVGFSANGTQQNRASIFIVQGGATRGNTITGTSTPLATNTRPRGVVFSPPVDAQIDYMEFQTAPGSKVNAIKIWESTQLPNDPPIYSFTPGGSGRASSELSGTIAMEPPFVARRNKTYYICWAFSANSTNPTCLVAEDYTSYPTVLQQNVDNFTIMPLVADTGSNTWSISYDQYPRFQLLLGDLTNPTITTGY